MRTMETEVRPFGQDDVNNKELVIKMLEYEEAYIRSDEGQARYKDPMTRPRVSLDNEYAFNRLTLAHFGFDTSDESVAWYRRIFRTYYRSPTDYDADVINASHYMRNNRCVFYTAPELNVGDEIPDVPLYRLDGKVQTSMYDVLGEKRTMICAFSNT